MTTHRSYADLFESVLDRGQEVSARGMRAKELVGTVLIVSSDLVPSRPNRVSALGYMEACQFIAGIFDKDSLVRVAPKADHSLFTPQMAYGPRQAVGEYVIPQLSSVIDELGNDPDSRRAVIALPVPGERLAIRPCTSTIQFLIRGGCLQTVVSMRSWDLWWGLPYDITMFNTISACVGACVGVELDWTTIFAGSAHIYEPHWGLSPHPDRRRMAHDHGHQSDPVWWRDWAEAQVYDEGWLTGPPLGFRETTV